MLISTIKYFFIYYSCLYICNKISPFPKGITRILHFSSCALAFSIITTLLDIQCVQLKYCIPLLLFWLIISFVSNKPKTSFIATTISFCISFSLHALISFLIDFISYILTGHFTPYFALSIIAGILQSLISLHLFMIKRIRTGINVLLAYPTYEITSVLCILFFSTLAYAHLHDLFKLAFIISFIILAFLIYWWQAQITKSYKRSLEQREMESLRTELQEKNMTMIKVMEESERVHHINHRDNSLLTTLDYAVMSILEMDFSDEAAVKDRCKELATEIHRARDRRVTTVHTDIVPSTRYKTNITLLDLLLNNTSKRALDEHVLFSVHVRADLSSFIPGAITDDDLVYLLSDLLENAFVATRDSGSRMIQLQFYRWNKHLVVEIADNGIPFEVDSILQMGIERRTTHGDTGGTGVGLMDIWEIKEKYGATYHLDEYESATPFSKKISLTFDKKNRYSVRTWRKNDILSRSKRIDLQVYGQNED